jgi:NAD(P)-dependent dehydrogenase (short-subunit alcohol dehydrogenase family)
MYKNILEAMKLDGKTALITGGNHGIGLGIFKAFAQCGANVAIMGRNTKNNEEAINEVQEEYEGKFRSYVGDVTRREDCEWVVNEVKRDYGVIDILVNNSGISRHCRTFDYDEQLSQWYDVMNVNINGLFMMSLYAGRVMKEQGYGSIINISSISSKIVNFPQWQPSYNASKAAVDQLTRSLGAEWAEYNIRVNAIAPGYVSTGIIPPDEGYAKGFAKYWTSVTPMKRFADPIEIASLAVYLASDASSYCTGGIFTADGGYSLAK